MLLSEVASHQLPRFAIRLGQPLHRLDRVGEIAMTDRELQVPLILGFVGHAAGLPAPPDRITRRPPVSAGDWLCARIRAITACMHPAKPDDSGFKRQVVFRVGSDDWTLLQRAASEHGSIQAALLAAIRRLAAPPPEPPTADPATATLTEPDAEPVAEATPTNSDPPDGREEIGAREAATILGLKTSTISGYIRTGRLPGRYDAEPTWRGWLTTHAAVTAYAKQRLAPDDQRERRSDADSR